MPPRPEKPNGLNTPGLNWRRRSNSNVAYWVARPDLVKRGYSLKSVRLWPPSNDAMRLEPQADEWSVISSNCVRLQTEMLQWANVAQKDFDPRSVYNGTMASLIEVYQRDPDSPFHGLREKVKERYVSNLKTLKQAVGGARIPELTFREFKRWHKGFCKPEVEGDPQRKARGHGLMTMIRIVVAFGSLLKLPGCRDAKETLGDMEFPVPKARKEFMTAEWDAAVRKKAHEMGYPSIAFAQALMYGLGVRQKDTIGEWSRNSEPGLSDVVDHGRKWLFGMRWENTEGLIMTHRLSKSIRGRDGILDPEVGKIKEFDLHLYPMVMEELAHIPLEARVGPLVKEDRTGLPWKQKSFGRIWRKVARAAGVPNNVQNRDNRAAAATEVTRVAGVEKARQALGHSRETTTRGYVRGENETTAEVAILRFPNNPKTP